jgi:uncharacterized protein involved in exopolysaccharide biosynthesis
MRRTNSHVAVVTASRADPEVSLGALVRPFARGWRVVAATLALGWAGTAAMIVLPERRYVASTVVASVPSLKAGTGIGGLSSLMGGAQTGGVQSTPYFVVKLLLVPGVLEHVAMEPAEGDTGTLTGARSGARTGARVIERVLRRPMAEITAEEIGPTMRQVMAAEVDKQTGLVEFRVTLPDSALARRVSMLTLHRASETYARVVQSQAGSQRAALQARVDSAERRLRRAENAMLDFVAGARAYVAYSSAAVVRQRLERELAGAQTVQAQAVADREAATARELEDAPAIVVVDALPDRLKLTPRQGLLKVLVGTVLALGVATALLALLGYFAAPRAAAAPAAPAADDEAVRAVA